MSVSTWTFTELQSNKAICRCSHMFMIHGSYGCTGVGCNCTVRLHKLDDEAPKDSVYELVIPDTLLTDEIDKTFKQKIDPSLFMDSGKSKGTLSPQMMESINQKFREARGINMHIHEKFAVPPPMIEERKYMSLSFNSISENDAVQLLTYINENLERIGYTVYYADPIDESDDEEEADGV